MALDGHPFHYQAGQAAALAVDSVPPTPYSIASAPFETVSEGWLEFLVKVDGSNRFGATVATIARGAIVEVTGPVGDFTTSGVRPDSPMLFVAGGTGIAPLRSMIRQAIADGHRGGLSLVYSARNPSEFAYLAELQELNRRGQLALTLTLTGQSDDWIHLRGRTGIAHLEEQAHPGVVAFVCGPVSMVADIPAALESLGVTRDRIRTDNW